MKHRPEIRPKTDRKTGQNYQKKVVFVSETMISNKNVYIFVCVEGFPASFATKIMIN